MSAQNAKAARIAASYGELKKLIDSDSAFDSNTCNRIIKVANKIVNDDHNQSEAWTCKVVAYIQQEQFKNAATTISKAPNKQDMQFERAYCQYRLNDVDGALETLRASSDKNTPRGKELLAQIYFKLEQYDDCYSVYRELVRSSDDDLDRERTTNLAAVQVHRTRLGLCDVPLAPQPKAPYEQWYNSGCAALAAGNTREAAARLDTALRECEAALKKEKAPQDEIDQEQAIIKVQQGYCLQLQEKEKDALQLYNSVQDIISDPALLAILYNNISASSARDSSVFDVRKKMKNVQTPELLHHKLTSVQRDQMALNNCILAYQAQQSLQEDTTILQECEKLLSLSQVSDGLKLQALQVKTASLAKAGKVDQALSCLHDWVKKHPSDRTVAILAATQLTLTKSDVNAALDELNSLPPADKYRPGVVGALVTLYNHKKQKSSVIQILDEAVNWHAKNAAAGNKSALENLLRRASDLQLREGNPEAAVAALEQLRISSPETNDACVASLINAYSQFNKSKALALSRELPEITSESVDAEALESSLGPKYFQKAAHKLHEEESAAVGKTSSGTRVKPRKKKKRKTVLPKSYVEGVAPDPERWLPRWQRKSGGARRRRDRKKDKDVGRGTQGGTGDATDKYDITKNPGQYKSSATIQQQPEPSGPRRNMPRKKNKKK